MPYLVETDYRTLIKDDRLDIFLEDFPGIKTEAERMAQAQMESYLNARFDCAAIFILTGEDRPADLVMYMTDIVLYHIHSRSQPRNIPELRVRRYEDAIAWLEMVAKGQLSPGLPPLSEGSGATLKFGSDYWGELTF